LTRSSKLVLAALLALLPLSARAQSHPLAGRWSIEYAAGMRMEDGEATPIVAKALLTIAVVGDSLVATVRMEPNPNLQPRPEARFAALKAEGNEITFVQRSEAKLNMNGEERTAWAISTWSLKADGDLLTGTLGREIEGMVMPMPLPQPVTGRRVP
jgi:hypothetical protein